MMIHVRRPPPPLRFRRVPAQDIFNFMYDNKVVTDELGKKLSYIWVNMVFTPLLICHSGFFTRARFYKFRIIFSSAGKMFSLTMKFVL